MKRELLIFSKASLLYALSDIALKGVTFLLLPVIVAYLSAEEYGIYSLVDTLRRIEFIFFAAISSAAVSRHYQGYKNNDEKRDLLGASFLVIAAICALVIIGLEVWGELLASFVFSSFPYEFVRYATLIAASNAISTTVLLEKYRAEEKPVQFFITSIPIFAGQLICMLIFVVVLEMGIRGLLIGLLLGSLIPLPWYLFKTIKTIRFNTTWSSIRAVLLFGFPLIPHQLASWGIAAFDRILIERFLDTVAVGVYSFAYQFGMLFALIVFAANRAWTPVFLRNMDSGASKQALSDLVKSYWVILSLIGFSILIVTEPLIRIITADEQLLQASSYAPLIILAFLAFGMYSVPSNDLFYQKRTQAMARGTFAGLTVNVILNIIFLPRYGLYAAAANTFIAYLVLFLVVYIPSHRSAVIKYPWGEMVKLAIVLGICGALVTASDISLNPFVSLTTRAVGVVCSWILALWILGYANARNINAARRKLTGV